ncbi:MAG: hypothetical protein JO037_00655 [Actinobacteria bacterium]|nr:hypothetical protein [Actinomycetota bacterium]
MKLRRLVAIPGTVLLVGATLATTNLAAAASTSQHATINCEYSALCAEVANPSEIFGSEYVGHDEPSAVFYSNVRGAGNHMTYSLRLPRDPSPARPNTPGKSYQFELNGAIWFGMALCATQSYPLQVSTCTPDSDTNITPVLARHPGTAFMELQLYPPGWVPWPTWQVATGASGCDATRWCAAMNIFSLAEDPVHGTMLNSTCLATVGSPEYFNFAFLTKDGRPTATPNPVQATTATFTPDLRRDLLMNSGDDLSISLGDTPNGLRTTIHDRTTGATGSMTASAANGFGQVQYDPTGTSCVNLPYDFHPMYSTSSEQTRVIWAAHSYNISFTSEIGHFENCTGPNPIPATPFGLDASGKPISCPAGNSEGFGRNKSPTDGDDNFCFPGTEALRIHINGCTDTNTGFDGLSYQPVWPDGNTALHPQSVLFSSPRTGPGDRVNYARVAFEADLPRIETNTCDRTTGAGCTLIPTTDKGTPAAFYPFFSAFQNGTQNEQGNGGGCRWGFGNVLPGGNNFGRNAQYGSLLSLTYLVFGGGGTTHQLINDFRQVIPNPCPAGGNQD